MHSLYLPTEQITSNLNDSTVIPSRSSGPENHRNKALRGPRVGWNSALKLQLHNLDFIHFSSSIKNPQFRELWSWCHVWKREEPEEGGGGTLSSHLRHLFPRYRHVHQCKSRSESKHCIRVVSGAREGLLRLMMGVWRAPFSPTHPAKDGFSCIHGYFRSLCYLHWFMRLLHPRSITDHRRTSAGGLMREDPPGLGFCSQSSPGRLGE